MVSTGISALRSAWRQSAWPRLSPLERAVRMKSSLSVSISEERMTRARIEACGKASAIAGNVSALIAGQKPASHPGKAAGREPAQIDREDQHQDHREPEIGDRHAKLGGAHDRQVGGRVSAGGGQNSGRKSNQGRKRQRIKRQRQGNHHPLGDQFGHRDPVGVGKCRNRPAAGLPPIRDSAAAGAHRGQAGYARRRPPQGRR